MTARERQDARHRAALERLAAEEQVRAAAVARAAVLMSEPEPEPAEPLGPPPGWLGGRWTKLSYAQRERWAERARLGLGKGEWAERQPCGTRSAYQMHRYRGETPCDACVEGRRAYERNRRRKAGIPRRQPGVPRPPRVLQPCGTMAAFSRHRRAGERPCGLCRDANNEYERRRRRLRRADPAVRERVNEYERERRAAKRAVAGG